MLRVVMLNVVMARVVAPKIEPYRRVLATPIVYPSTLSQLFGERKVRVAGMESLCCKKEEGRERREEKETGERF
jgi:hypothetical protein